MMMMRLAKICCLLLISGPGCLVQSIILNQIKIPLHPQVTFINSTSFFPGFFDVFSKEECKTLQRNPSLSSDHRTHYMDKRTLIAKDRKRFRSYLGNLDNSMFTKGIFIFFIVRENACLVFQFYDLHIKVQTSP